MRKFYDDYFLKILHNYTEVLPIDVRKINLNINEDSKIDKNEILEIIKNVFLRQRTSSSDSIINDIDKVMISIIYNEKTDMFSLVEQSRFSIVFKIGSKVLKIGFPKITYNYPKSKLILDSIIRKQYYYNGDRVLFLEVQEYKSVNLSSYSEKEQDEILYQIWKHFRRNGIIWYDSKAKNVVVNDGNCKSCWDSKYYKLSNDDEKGIYKIDELYTDMNIYDKFLIVDTDLFVTLETMKKVEEIFKDDPKLAFFSNWKFKKYMKYEERYNDEV